jgi:hypothetical protein
MVDYTVGLVTIFHPNQFLGCSSAALGSYPHAVRYRSERTKRVEQAGVPFQMQYLEDHLVISNGKEIMSCRDTIVDGSVLVGYLGDPRLVRIPDEKPPRPKWRLEFWMHWPEDDPPLQVGTRTALRTAIGQSRMRVRGVWVNPRIDVRWPDEEWVNLVVGPCSAQASQQFLPTSFTLHHNMSGKAIISLPSA